MANNTARQAKRVKTFKRAAASCYLECLYYVAIGNAERAGTYAKRAARYARKAA